MKSLTIILFVLAFACVADAGAIVYTNGTDRPSWNYQGPDPSLFPQATARAVESQTNGITIPLPQGGSLAEWIQNVLLALAMWWLRMRTFPGSGK